MADPVQYVLERGAARVTDINETTRDAVQSITDGVANGLTMMQVADAIDSQRFAAFSDYRSELIARTELMQAYNAAALNAYGEAGITEVQAIDGDEDEECAARDGEIFSVDEADGIEDHPNGTLDWVPVMPTEAVDAGGAMTEEVDTSETDAIREQEAADIAANRERSDAAVAAAKEAAGKPMTEAERIRAAFGAEPKPVSTAFDTAIGQVENHPLALRDKEFVKVISKVKSALRTVDDTFHDGKLPEMPRIGPLKNASRATQGQYTHTGFPGSDLPISLEFRGEADMSTVFHEMTHFIDQHGLGYQGQFGSKLGFGKVEGKLGEMIASVERDLVTERALGSSAERIAALEERIVQMRLRADIMEPVARAIMESDGYGQMLRQAAERGAPSDIKKWVAYAKQGHESFARAMGQYLAKRAGPDAIAQVEAKVYYVRTDGSFVTNEATGVRMTRPLTGQWGWEDFQAIDRAITEMLQKIGWLE